RLQAVVEQVGGIGHKGSDSFRVSEIFIAELVGVKIPGGRVGGQGTNHPVLSWNDGAEPTAEVIRLKKLADADPVASTDLVLIARADSSTGRSDRRARGLLGRPFFGNVIRKDHMRVIAH